MAAMPGRVQRFLTDPDLTTEAGFWPGSVPSFIQPPAETSQVEPWNLSPIVKGWHRFVRENWVSSNDENDDSKARQRRSLITTWASAEQDFRDEISTYGYYKSHSFWGCYLITEASIPSTNWALWLKILLLFYDWDNDGHIADETFVLTPKENDAITLDNFKRYQALETADFDIVKFNSSCHVLFDPFRDTSILVDEYALNTGLVLIAFFGIDGTPKDVYRIRLLDLFEPYARIVGVGKSCKEQMEFFGGDWDTDDQRIWLGGEGMEMKQPLLDILFTHTESTDTPVSDDRETIEERLSKLAPGYLEAEREADGLAKDFDLFGSGFHG